MRILTAYGLPEGFVLILVIIGKFLIIILVTILCSKLNFVRMLFGFSNIKVEEKYNG